MASKDDDWTAQFRNVFPTFNWPWGMSPAETMLTWMDAQKKFFDAATEASRQVWTIAHKEVETGNGIVQRLMTAETPEEAVAAQRDLAELMSSVYVEQMTAIGQQINQLAQAVPAAKKAADADTDPPPKKKRAAK